MSPEKPGKPGVRELTRRLVARETAEGDAPDASAAASQAACERAHRELVRWLGANGRDALFARALAHARERHPALEEISLRARAEPGLEGVAESIQTHGALAVATALEALLVALLELLGRLIGDDLVTRLVEQGGAYPALYDARIR